MEEVKEAGDSENQKDLVPAKVKITEHVDGGYAWVVILQRSYSCFLLGE